MRHQLRGSPLAVPILIFFVLARSPAALFLRNNSRASRASASHFTKFALLERLQVAVYPCQRTYALTRTNRAPIHALAIS